MVGPRDAVSDLGLLPEEEANTKPLARGVARGARRRGRPAKPSTFAIAGDVLALLPRTPRKKAVQKVRLVGHLRNIQTVTAPCPQAQSIRPSSYTGPALPCLANNQSSEGVRQDAMEKIHSGGNTKSCIFQRLPAPGCCKLRMRQASISASICLFYC